MSKRLSFLFAPILFFPLFSGCGGSSYVSPPYDSSLDTIRQITDADIRQAFDAKPQLLRPVNLAVYNSGYHSNFNAHSLAQIPGISQIYGIPRVLVEGDEREGYRRHRYYEQRPRPLDIKQLRLYAAQAKCDLLLLYHVSVEERVEPNALVLTHMLIVPGIFMPSFHIYVNARSDQFYFDVRNGYLYSRASADTTYARRYVTYWATENISDLTNSLVQSLGTRIVESTSAILNDKRFFLDTSK